MLIQAGAHLISITLPVLSYASDYELLSCCISIFESTLRNLSAELVMTELKQFCWMTEYNFVVLIQWRLYLSVEIL